MSYVRFVDRFVDGPSALVGVLVGVFLLAVPSQGKAQTPDQAALPDKAALKEAFEGGNARAVLAGASSRLDVSLLGKSTQYSRSQARYVLQDFFKNHPPRRFAFQEVSQSGQSRFAMGRYWHEGAKRPLRVYLRFQKAAAEKKNGWALHEIRVEQP